MEGVGDPLTQLVVDLKETECLLDNKRDNSLTSPNKAEASQRDREVQHLTSRVASLEKSIGDIVALRVQLILNTTEVELTCEEIQLLRSPGRF